MWNFWPIVTVSLISGRVLRIVNHTIVDSWVCPNVPCPSTFCTETIMLFLCINTSRTYKVLPPHYHNLLYLVAVIILQFEN